jgi:hypothetical protein
VIWESEETEEQRERAGKRKREGRRRREMIALTLSKESKKLKKHYQGLWLCFKSQLSRAGFFLGPLTGCGIASIGFLPSVSLSRENIDIG